MISVTLCHIKLKLLIKLTLSSFWKYFKNGMRLNSINSWTVVKIIFIDSFLFNFESEIIWCIIWFKIFFSNQTFYYKQIYSKYIEYILMKKFKAKTKIK